MDERQKQGFYWGAAIFLGLESDEVDAILTEYGLNVDRNSAEACISALRDHDEHAAPPTPPGRPGPQTSMIR